MSYLTKTLGLAALLMLSLPATSGAVVVTDPIGDTFGIFFPDKQHDITSMSVDFAGDYLTLGLEFADEISPPSFFRDPDPDPLYDPGPPYSVYGYLLIDVDQDPSTGVDPAQYDVFLAEAGHLGIDYFVNLFSEFSGLVDVVGLDLFPADVVPIAFGPDSLSVTLSRALIGDDDGNITVGAVMGTFYEPTDKVFAVIPEPGSLLIWSLLGAMVFVGGARGRLRLSRRSA